MKKWTPITVMFIVGLAAGIVAVNRSQVVRWLFASAASPAVTAPIAGQSAAVAPSGSDGQSSDAKAVREELRMLRAEVKNLRASSRSAAENWDERPRPTRDMRADESPRDDASDGQRTLAYWNELNAVMAKEAAIRATPRRLSAENAAAFVTGRMEAYQFASQAIRRLDPQGVDPEVVAIAAEIARWYDEGTANGRESQSLLDSSDAAVRRGSRGGAWQTNERRHRDRGLEINRRGGELRQRMNGKYGLSFPMLL